ncbi:MAG: nuclear transport factor 2 family protein [Acetobacteraceae bacterium]
MEQPVSGGPSASALQAERVIRAYFAACNTADVDAMMACFTDDAVHYFPAGMPGGPWRGAQVIAENWARFVRDFGSAWTIDRFLCDPTGSQAVIEWTHYRTRPNKMLRGDEWYVLDAESGRIKEIRAYYAAAADQTAATNELSGFDYAGRGYHLECPIPRGSVTGGEASS